MLRLLPGFCCLIQSVNLYVLTYEFCLFALLLIYLNCSAVLNYYFSFFPLFVSFLVPYLKKKNAIYVYTVPKIMEITLTQTHITLSPAPTPIMLLLSRRGQLEKERLLSKWVWKNYPFANYLIWFLPIFLATLPFPNSILAMLSILFYESIKIVSVLGSF